MAHIRGPLEHIKKTTMTRIIIFLTILTALTISCGQKNDNSSIVGTWRMDNLNSVDSSVNRTTLLSTSLVDNYSKDNLLEFSGDKAVTLKTKDGKDLGIGTYTLTDDTLAIKFPDDNVKSEYKITHKTEKTIKMTAWNDSETVKISLSKKE